MKRMFTLACSLLVAVVMTVGCSQDTGKKVEVKKTDAGGSTTKTVETSTEKTGEHRTDK